MPQTWAELLRNAVERDGRSRYAIAKAAELQESQLARFIGGSSLDLATAERLGRVLGVKLVAPKGRRKKPGK